MTKTLTGLLTDLVDNTQKSDTLLSEETLHTLNELAAEAPLTFADAAPTKTERDPAANPYKWGADADEFLWNEGQWE